MSNFSKHLGCWTIVLEHTPTFSPVHSYISFNFSNFLICYLKITGVPQNTYPVHFKHCQQGHTQKNLRGFQWFKITKVGIWGAVPPRCRRIYSFSDSFRFHFLCFVTRFYLTAKTGCLWTGVPRVVNSRETNSVTYINTPPTKL